MSKLTKDEIYAKLKPLLMESYNAGEDKVGLDAKVAGGLAADSLDLVETMMAIETAFEVDFPEEEVSKIVTVQDIVDYIHSYEKK